MTNNVDLIAILHAGVSSAHCGMYLYNLDSITRQQIYQELETERLQTKYLRMKTQHELGHLSWNQIAFNGLIKYMGDMKNRKNYLDVASRIDFSTLRREFPSLQNIEALLIGTAGLLTTLPDDDFSREFVANGKYLLHKYQITPLRWSQWTGTAYCKAPIIRLSQMARIVYNNEMLFNQVINCRTRDDIFNLCNVEASQYLSHYLDDAKHRRIGADVCDILGINLFVPLLYAYGHYSSDDEMTDAANNLNESLPAEKNAIISRWCRTGITPTTAYETQALIELNNSYCKTKSCERCHIYKHMISNSSILSKIPTFLHRLTETRAYRATARHSGAIHSISYPKRQR